MKKIVYILLVFIFILCGCQVDYEITETNGGTQAEEVKYPVFDYEWIDTDVRGNISDFPFAAPMPRGIMFDLKCYSPKTGTVTSACADPLCEHYDCAYANWVYWLQYPVSNGKDIYIVKRNPKEGGSGTDKVSILIKTDSTGMDVKELYSTDNTIIQFFVIGEDVYISELKSKAGFVLSKYDSKTKKLVSPKINSEEGLVHNGAIAVGSSVCYVYDGSLYRCNPEFTSSEKIIEDFAYSEMYTDGKDIYIIRRTEGIVKYDLTSKESSFVYKVPNETYINKHRMSDKGIDFVIVKRSDNWHPKLEEYKELLYANSIYSYNFGEREIKETKLGDFYLFDYITYGDKIYASKAKEDSSGKATSGKWHVSDMDDVNFQPIE